MGFKIDTELQKFQQLGAVINTIAVTTKSDRHMSTLVKASHSIATSAFDLHMTSVASGDPKRFAHMYEWNQVGDPNAKLWRHVLKSAGARGVASFEFKASTSIVPVDPKLDAVGVKHIHVFVWKAMVMENGLPVKISPKLAKYLVFLKKGSKGEGSLSGNGYERDGIIYYKGTVSIPSAGNALIRGAFSRAWASWWGSGEPDRLISQRLQKPYLDNVQKTVAEAIGSFANLREKNKSFSLASANIDPGVADKFLAGLEKDYIGAAAQRRSFLS